MKTTPNIETTYTSRDGIVSVIRKKTGLRRRPKHGYACVIFILKPTKGTRVCTLPNGSIEYMASFDEIRAKLHAIDPEIAAKLPETMKNKPLEIKDHWDSINKKRPRPE